jgi:hypothetical protein
MSSYKEHLLLNLERELVLLKQLAPFIEEKDLEFRTNDKSRNTIELMRYLSGIGGVMMRWLIVNDLTKEEREKIAAYRATLTIENFAARLDEQIVWIKGYMDQVTEDDLLNKIVELPNKETMPLGAAIINAPIKWLASYRMQLFLHLKMNGRAELNTADAWRVKESI